jgi:hypothetical protein
MAIDIHRAPDEMMLSLLDANATLAGKCFETCVIAVLGLRASWQLQYVLGFVTPPGHSPVAHAWLQQETLDGPIYLDPTLQNASLLWQKRMAEFAYEKRFCFTREELLEWFRTSYPNRRFNELGIPDGPIRGPIINAAGELV